MVRLAEPAVVAIAVRLVAVLAERPVGHRLSAINAGLALTETAKA